MLFDGRCMPGTPLARLLEADRRLEAERRAKAKLCPKPAPSAESLALRVRQARESVVVLNLLEELFGDGEHWTRSHYHDSFGRHCLVGGLQRIRARRGLGDRAGVYLSRAIAQTSEGGGPITHSNDTRQSYLEICAVIRHARALAQQAADSQNNEVQTD